MKFATKMKNLNKNFNHCIINKSGVKLIFYKFKTSSNYKKP